MTDNEAVRHAKARSRLRLHAWRAVGASLSATAPSRFDCLLSMAGEEEIARLKRSLRRERALGGAGHWSYDLNRHIALRQALLRAGATRSSVRPGEP